MKKLLKLTFLIFISCSSSKSILISNEYKPKEEVGIQNNELKTNGFYYSKHEKRNKKFINPIVLFEKGPVMLFDNFGNGSNKNVKIKNGQKCYLDTGQNHETIIQFFECYLKIVDFVTIYSVFFVKDGLIKIESRGNDFLLYHYGNILNDSTFVINKIVNLKAKRVYNEKRVYHFKKSQKPDLTKSKLYSGLEKYYFK